jgi:hypothetical protein
MKFLIYGVIGGMMVLMGLLAVLLPEAKVRLNPDLFGLVLLGAGTIIGVEGFLSFDE